MWAHTAERPPGGRACGSQCFSLDPIHLDRKCSVVWEQKRPASNWWGGSWRPCRAVNERAQRWAVTMRGSSYGRVRPGATLWSLVSGLPLFCLKKRIYAKKTKWTLRTYSRRKLMKDFWARMLSSREAMWVSVVDDFQQKSLWTNLNEKPQPLIRKKNVCCKISETATSALMHISSCLPEELRRTEFKARLRLFLALDFSGDWWTIFATLPSLVCVHMSGSADPCCSNGFRRADPNSCSKLSN